MKSNKIIAVCLSAAMVFGSFSTVFSAEEATGNTAASKFSDTNGHWAAAAIEKWAGFNVLNGSKGVFRPNDYITRAEMATVLDNMMDYQIAAKNSFSDVPSGAWYEAAVLKANAAGILNGDGLGHATPTAEITKEQAALMLARAFSVDADQGNASKFSDKAKISSWAKSLVFGMEAAGFISGYNNQFNPQSSITRAEVVTIIDNAVKGYYTDPGTYTEDVDGLAVIKSEDVVIKDAVIDGDLIIAEGVADGDATLEGAEVTGDLIVRGGGESSVVITGGSEIQSVKVEKLGGKIRIFADGVVIDDVEASEEVILEGSFGSVTITADASVIIKGNVATLDLEQGGTADIQSGTVTTLNVPAGAAAVIAGNATVRTANLTGSAEIKGTGKIGTANISGEGAKIQQTPSKTNLAEGSAATVGGKEVTGGSSSQNTRRSGGGGGVDDTPYTLEEITGSRVLLPYTLVGSYEDGKINTYSVNSRRTAYMWNAGTDTFDQVSFNASNIVGNFVQLQTFSSEDDDVQNIDGVLIVRSEDSTIYWDEDMYWLDGVGAASDPGVPDETGNEIFGAEYVIPMGERQLSGYGLGDWSGVTDFSNIIGYAAGPGDTLPDLEYYWPQHDYYNAESSDTLTMLTNYKSYLQTTGANCGPASALTVLEWFGQRGDLNDNDLVALREKPRWSGASTLQHMINIFENLEELGMTSDWEFESSYDYVDSLHDEDEENDYYPLYDPQWIQSRLAAGSPIMVGWNSFGGHWQVIIGYDDMGTDGTADDVLILMDPYDSTDHRNDGYNIQSFERLAYGVQGFDQGINYEGTLFLVATPDPEDPDSDWNYEGPEMYDGTGYTIPATSAAMDFGASYGSGIESNWISYRDTAADIYNVYPDTEIFDKNWNFSTITGPALTGPATEHYRHSEDVENSSYYSHYDFYNIDSDTIPSLTLLEKFRTTQQATEWTCGLASALMVIEWFGGNEAGLTEIDLAQMRQGGRAGATTVNGMEQVFSRLNGKNLETGEDDPGCDGDWAWFTMRDLGSFIDPEDGELEIGRHFLEWGGGDDGLIPYLLSNGIPIMIGWDEWGGHWQVIIGYDDMGTYETQDDVLILADPYDTTDHNMDGYVIESFERLVYGWDAAFDEDYSFIVAFPASEKPEVIDELGLEEPYYTPKAD